MTLSIADVDFDQIKPRPHDRSLNAAAIKHCLFQQNGGIPVSMELFFQVFDILKDVRGGIEMNHEDSFDTYRHLFKGSGTSEEEINENIYQFNKEQIIRGFAYLARKKELGS